MKMKNTMNVGATMRKYAPKGCRVSPDAVKELISRFDIFLERRMKDLYGITKRDKRKTIMEDDVVHLFGFKEFNIDPDEEA